MSHPHSAAQSLVDMQQTRPVFAIASQLRRNWTFLNEWITSPQRNQESETAPVAVTRGFGEKRMPATGPVEFGYIDNDGRVRRGSGRLIDRSDSGMRFWTTEQLTQGAEFLVWEPGRSEHSATIVWTKRKTGGWLVGAQLARGKRRS